MMAYETIFITNLPAFYKIRQWNELNRYKRVLVIYTGDTADQRNADFFKGVMEFDHVFLQGGIFRKLYTVFRILITRTYDQLILGGWDSIITLAAAIVSPKKKNAVIVESTIMDSSVEGYKGWIKKKFMGWMATAYPAGILNVELVQALGFSGRVCVSGGCGLLNYLPQPSYEPRMEVKSFLYVGRLSPEKNLKLLIETFNTMPSLILEIIGFGPQEDELKAMAKENVRFLGQINNEELSHYYRQSDVFILPSSSETWGLVVEEALNNGTPVIVSDAVGCHRDLVTPETGLVFESGKIDSLTQCIDQICEINLYNQLRQGVSRLDFHKRAKQQIETFI